MKRGGPLRRRTPLAPGTKPLAPGKPMARTGELRAKPKPPVDAAERAAQVAWYQYVLRRAQGCCECCGERIEVIRGVARWPDGTAAVEDTLQAHHIVDQQTLRKHRRGAYLWDPRLGMAVRRTHHESHTSGARRIPRSRLRADAVALAGTLGLAHIIERRYS